MSKEIKQFWLMGYDSENCIWTDNEPEFPEDTIHVVDMNSYTALLTEARKLRKLVPLVANGLSTGAKMILENFDAKYPTEEK